ncbi:TRAP transporter substrate-binding protein [Telmatospirillum sp. J64-1]|uniref:TRAP transporter substrate-binding protein n=1 Tax=Telmatospirillum sp. J64-1 TaxID=2502183 RepID=UPI00115E1F69|nr:TRAP transporter substrate-binding protein [Telmatospirillum sp. J64-1]
MKFIARATFCGVAAIASFGAFHSEAEAKTVLDVAMVWPEGNYHVTNAHRFAEEVEKATNGNVALRIHAGGELGLKGPELMRSVRDGLVPMAQMLITQQVGDAPFLGIESLPFLTRNQEDAAILHKHIWPEYERIAAQFNQKFLFAVPWPGQGVFTGKPVESAADLKGVVIRTIDQNGSRFFSALGASPVQLPWGEVMPALASGALKGVTTSSSSGVDGSFWDLLSHFSRFNWQQASDVMTINMDSWNKLSEADRAAIEEVAARLQPEFWAAAAKVDADNTATLASNGMTVTEVGSSFAEELEAAGKPIWQDFINRVGGSSGQIIADYLKETGR